MDGRTAPGVAASAERRALDRERQAEVLGPLEALTRSTFDHARIVAGIIGFKQTRMGGIEITLSVPYEYRQDAAPLLDASGAILCVDFVPWKQGATHE